MRGRALTGNAWRYGRRRILCWTKATGFAETAATEPRSEANRRRVIIDKLYTKLPALVISMAYPYPIKDGSGSNLCWAEVRQIRTPARRYDTLRAALERPCRG